jgi:hypothetical protein
VDSTSTEALSPVPLPVARGRHCGGGFFFLSRRVGLAKITGSYRKALGTCQCLGDLCAPELSPDSFLSTKSTARLAVSSTCSRAFSTD